MCFTVIEDGLMKIAKILKDHKNDGKDFNIFKILGVQHLEVRLHTALIAELLDPKGSHGQDTFFLDHFLAVLTSDDRIKQRIKGDFSINDLLGTKVEKEKTIPTTTTDGKTGGRIDIVIEIGSYSIFIENKIYAADQYNQLLRYHNYDPKALLLYLTLKGEDATPNSTGDNLKKGSGYFCISYQETIMLWLQNLIKPETKLNIQIRATIEQYILTLQKLINMPTELEKELLDLIGKQEIYKIIPQLHDAYHTFRRRTYEKFFESLNKNKENQIEFNFEDQPTLKGEILVDKDGLYYGYTLAVDKNIYDAGKEYYWKILKEVDSRFYTNDIYVGWIYSNIFKNFYDDDKVNILELEKSEESVDKLINAVIDDFKELNNKIKNKIQSKNK